MNRILLTGIIILFSYLFQSTLFQSLKLGNVAPNLLLIVTVSYALIKGKRQGAIVGFFCGLMIDIFFGKIIGFNALIYLYIGYCNGYLYKLFYKGSLLIPAIMIAISDLAYGIIKYMLFMLNGKTDINYYFMNIILPEIIYTTVLMFLIYRIILVINDTIEKAEKGV